MGSKQKIRTFLWFDNNAEEAVDFYVSVFKNARIGTIMRCGNEGPWPKGTVLTINFELDGQEFIAMNGGPQFKFTEAISLFVTCETQEEIDYYWDRLSDGGATVACGWLKDKFGLSWQVAPRGLLEMLQDEDTARADRVMQAMRQMIKLDIATLQRAYEQT